MHIKNPVSIELDVTELRAVARHAANKDIHRYYLCGVCVELGAAESRLVATDGCRLACMRIVRSLSEGTLEAPVQVIVPNDVLKALPKRGMVTLQVMPNPEGAGDLRQAAFVTASGRNEFKLIDGKFPDYRRVVPAKVSGRVCQFNPQFLLDFQKSAEDLGAKAQVVIVSHNGAADGSHGAALVSIQRDEEFIGVIMPVRQDNPILIAPRWIAPQPEAANEAKAA